MIKKICFSLWGNNPKYTIGAIKNTQLAKEIYPEWKTVFYIGNDVSENITKQLIDNEAELILMGDSGWNGMFWRFLGADSDDIYLCRDTDSRLNYREKAAVDAWLDTNKDFHIMRDHPFHRIEILGGAWGCRNGILKGLSAWIKDYDKRDFDNKYQVDQNFLKEVIYPKIKNKSYINDEFFEHKPFPKQRINNEYVGAPFNENDELIIGLNGEKYVSE